MSSFLLAQSGFSNAGFLQGNDERTNPNSFQWYAVGIKGQSPWMDGLLWPNSRMSGGDPTSPVTLFGADTCNIPGRWEPHPEAGGSQSMKKIIGFTKDANGNVLGNCVVMGFLTASGKYLRQLNSDAGGYYEFCSEYSAQTHFLVAYQVGSPDITGATVNTLVPA